MTSCASCGEDLAADARFCMACGHPAAGGRTCHDCGAELAPGAGFCTQCGVRVSESDLPPGPGYVVDGEWHRAPGEFVRQIPADQMRSAFARILPGIDLDAFFRGTLVGKVLDALQAKTIRVPAGSIGVVMVDGKCKRILPPGEQTTVDWLKELGGLIAGDISGAAGAAAGRVWGTDRLSFYLVDRRPIPVALTRDVATGGGTLTTVAARALIAVGTGRDSLGTFINDVVRDRESLSAQDIHVRFRTDVDQAITDALAAAGGDLSRAQAEANKTLNARFRSGTGLSFEVSLAPRNTVHRLDLRIGNVPSPSVTPCTECGAEVALGQKFCVQCGHAQPTPTDGATGDALFTRDGTQVEIDVVLSVQGPDTPAPPGDLLRGAAHRHLRDRDWNEIVTTEGFARLEEALRSAADEALQALGARLVALDLIDLRSQAGEWALNARADMERARTEALVGREWLDVESDQIELQELTLALTLRQQAVGREHRFAMRQAAVADAKRQAELDAAERQLAAQARDAAHEDAMAAGAQGQARAMQGAEHRAALARQEQALQSDLTRQQAQDEAEVEGLRREGRLAELRGLAELEAQVSAREHQQRVETISAMEGRSEAEILALQATQLAEQEHGAAFAEALGKIAEGQAVREERERADARLDAKDERVMGLMERMVGAAEGKEEAVRTAYQDSADTTRQMAQTAVESHARVAAAAPVMVPCTHCGTALPSGAKFCGSCGNKLGG